MTRRRSESAGSIWLIAACAALAACSAADSGPRTPAKDGGGAGGSSGGTGGGWGSTGGSAYGTGGAANTGGSSYGAGGSTSAGGSTYGTGGTTGTGGTSGGGQTGVLYSFDADVQGFVANQFGADAGSQYLSTQATISWDSGMGDPANGSLKLVIPFTDYGQQADFLVNIDPLKNLSGRTLYAKVKLDSGFSPDKSAPGGLVFYVQTTANWVYGQASWVNVTPAGEPKGTDWTEYTFNLAAPDAANTKPGFDASQIKAIGFRFDTGGGSGAASKPTTATVHIDTIGAR
jgi:hypothetical protein